MDNVMDKSVNISNDKKSVLEFDIEITGVDETDMEVRFIIEGKGIELGFNSKKISEKTWSVEIPAMKMLDSTAYPYYISVVVDGYAFKGISGNINVLSASSIKATGVRNAAGTSAAITKKVIKNKAKIKPAAAPSPLKVKDREQMLDELMPKKTAATNSGLDSSIIDTIERARKEVHKRVEDDKKVVKDKKEDLSDDITKIIQKAKNEIDKKVEKTEDKKVEKPTKKEEEFVKEKEEILTPGIGYSELPPTTDILVEEPTAPVGTFSAKQVATDLIKSVTGMGNKIVEAKGSPNSPVAKKKARADKVKEILASEIKEEVEKPLRQETTAKKIIRGNSIVEVDASKEDKIKAALKENEDDKRSVTTTPVNKTVH